MNDVARSASTNRDATAGATSATPGVRVAAVGAQEEVVAELLGHYFAELDARFLSGFQPEPSDLSTDEYAPPRGTFLIAYDGDRPIGCGALRPLSQSVGEIKRMWVNPRERSRGVARQLLFALEEAARNLGYGAIRLDTNEQLREAIALYSSSEYHDIAPYNANPHSGRWFEKLL